MKQQEKQRVVVMGEDRLEHRVCGQVAPGDVAEEVRLQRSKTFSFSLVQKATIPLNLYIMVCTSIIGHG